MEFLTLEILHLASLDKAEGETIHFEQGALGNSSIFSIVGPTGSGKSTLLDAICLALYNRAPRYPRRKNERDKSFTIYGEAAEGEKNRLAPTDSRNILTRGKKEGYSKLTFVANNGDVYRAEWHVYYKRKNFENADTQLYRLTQRDGRTGEEQCDWEQIPQIIGLDYEQFLSTVLLAQGSFANFLKAKEDDRYELLEKITGCERLYTTIADRIREKRDAAKDAYNKMNTQCAAYEQYLLDDETLAQVNKRIAELEVKEKEQQDKLLKINNEINWYASEQEHTANIAKAATRLEETRRQLNEAKGDIERLALHDATQPALALYKEMEAARQNKKTKEGEKENLTKEIKGKESNIQEEENELKAKNEAKKKAEETYNERKPHIDKARQVKGELLAARNVVKDKTNGQKDCYDAKQKAEKALEDNKKAIEEATKKYDEVTRQLNKHNEQVNQEKERLKKQTEEAVEALDNEKKKIEGQDADLLQKAYQQATQRSNDLKDAIRIQTELVQKSKQVGENEVYRKHLIDSIKQVEAVSNTLDIASLEQEVEKLKKLHTLMTSEKWEQHRHALEAGKPCPLCGAVEHPYKDDEALQPIVDELGAMLKQKEEALQQKQKRQKEIDSTINENKGKLDIIDKNDKTLLADIDKLKEEWERIHVQYVEWKEDVASLQALQSTIEQQVAEANLSLTTYNNRVKEIDRLQKEKDNIDKKAKEYDISAADQIEKITAEQNRAVTLLSTEQGKSENLQQQVKEKTEASHRATQELKEAQDIVNKHTATIIAEIGKNDPDKLEQQLQDEIKKADTEAKEKEKEIGEKKTKLGELKGQIERVVKDIAHEQSTADEKRQQMDRWLTAYNVDHTQRVLTLEDIALLYSSTDDWEKIRSRCQKLNDDHTVAQTTLTNAKETHNKHQEHKPQASLEELKVQKEALEHRNTDELTEKKAQIQNHRKAEEQIGAYKEALMATKQQDQDWEEITDAIGKDGKTMRKIAQCYTLRFLIEHANTEIRKFNSRYELQQVQNSLGIRVIDHDRGDDVRDTTSLSGGETFIVSLGLALGLSSLSSRNISFKNLFIDEGFGTLDPDYLATVIDSLSMLQMSQGKKVGVISHTDTMSERITTQIRIVPNGHTGSSHIEIYPE